MKQVAVPRARSLNGTRSSSARMNQATAPVEPAGFGGDVLRHLDLGQGFTVVEVAFAPRATLPPHSHDAVTLCLVLDGGFDERLEEEDLVCERHDLLLRPPGAVHSDQAQDGGARCLCLEVPSERWPQAPHLGAAFEEPRRVRQPALAGLAVRLQQELWIGDEAAKLVLQGLVLELIGLVMRAVPDGERSPEPWLIQVRQILHDRFAKRITLAELAEEVERHPSHLARQFRLRYGCSVGEFIRRLRLEQAMKSLVSCDEPISNVALACGFFDQSHFSNTFKRYTGLTPSEYRNRNRA